MLSYMLPTEDKPPPGDPSQSSRLQKQSPKDYPAARRPASSTPVTSPRRYGDNKTMIVSTKIEEQAVEHRPAAQTHNQLQSPQQQQHHQQYHPQHHSTPTDSPKHNGTVLAAPASTPAPAPAKKSTLHNSKVTKDDSLYSIDSDASTVGSDRKNKIFTGAKHASLKRVSFGSSKGSMVETLVYETPVQEEPEINHFLEHNGRLPPPIAPVPDTDEGREKVRVSLLGPQPSPATPGVLLLEPITQSVVRPIDMASISTELTTHTEHTIPAYHTQISTDSGWDNPFRPDGDLSREADEIVELIKGGKPITPTPGQSGPLPGCEDTGKRQTGDESSSSPLLKSSANSTTRHPNSSPRANQENGNAHGTPIKTTGANGRRPVNDMARPPSIRVNVDVERMTAQGPGDASQVEHVTLKKKPKCNCCVMQ